MPGINFRSIILSVLEADERIWFQNEEGEKELNQTLLLDLVEKIDDKIINLLLQEEALREKFFAKISPDTTEKQSTYVFKMNDFRFFMEENKIDNSYTAYKNRIGLTDGKKFLKDSNDIVLNWPYKDCILEGGQSNEEGSDTYFEYSEKDEKYEQKQAKRKEIFFNSVLAPDEIDRLLDPKALVNWKRFTKNGQIPLLRGGDKVDGVDALKRDKNGTIAENMIIKGNNLLAMHSLKKQFAGKVKLIYIDPPYNTGNDGFKYNDNFNHSTWLTFMKNRLEVARELLRDDGVIFVQCDDNEQAYLKVLMDEVFGRENFVTNFLWQRTKTPPRLSKNVARVHDFILCYGISKQLQLNKVPLKEEYINKTYKNLDNDSRGKWRLVPLLQPENSTNKVATYTLPDGRKITGKWRCSEDSFKYYIENDLLYYSEEGKPNRKLFLSEVKGQIPDTWLSDLCTNEKATKENFNIFNKSNFTAPKPEDLIKFIIEISTQPGDIVLDYHLGSGTTAAVAHKMGRQYIGIEQMDYVETIAVERLKKVIGQSTSPAKAGTPQEENSRKLTAKERQGLQEILEKIKNSNNSLV